MGIVRLGAVSSPPRTSIDAAGGIPGKGGWAMTRQAASTRQRRPVIELQNISKIYGSADTIVRAVDHVDLVVDRGDYVAIMGASGSGKSTLMNIIGCLDAPTQ